MILLNPRGRGKNQPVTSWALRTNMENDEAEQLFPQLDKAGLSLLIFYFLYPLCFLFNSEALSLQGAVFICV